MMARLLIRRQYLRWLSVAIGITVMVTFVFLYYHKSGSPRRNFHFRAGSLRSILALRNAKKFVKTKERASWIPSSLSLGKSVPTTKPASAKLDQPTSHDVTVFSTQGQQSRPRGFILGLHACDQLTGGAMNVMCWQCLATQLGPSVHLVEPFVRDSSFGAKLEDSLEGVARSNNVRLSDIYDIDAWNSYTDSNHFNRFARWEEFLEEAPRDVIFVKRAATSCKPEVLTTKMPFFNLFHFRVVKTVCFDFRKTGPLTLDQFKDVVYGNYSTSSVSVVVHRIAAIYGNAGSSQVYTALLGTPCDKGVFWIIVVDLLSASPSQKLYEDASKYIERYLIDESDEEGGYISLMIRLEHAVIRSSEGSRNDTIRNCLHRVREDLRTASTETGLNATFVALDAGKYGSATLRKSHVQEHVVEFMGELYGDSLSFEEWENSFEQVAGLEAGGHGNSGYIAMLQKVIASRSSCLILAGGGSFQNSALELYKLNHNQTEFCFISENC